MILNKIRQTITKAMSNNSVVDSIRQSMKFKVVTVPVLQDNYSYLLIDEEKKIAAAIDPVEPEKVIAAAKSNNVNIQSVLTTHHHWDHGGGNQKMVNLLKGLTIYGGDDRVEAITKKVSNNDEINVGDLKVTVLSSPAHTTGHVLYYVKKEDSSCIFTGDTLFIAGCGRLFEGNPTQMHHALNNVIGSLPDDTLVYCGHEYTYKNLLFAKTIEPDNQDLLNMLKFSEEQMKNNKPTVPSTIGMEKSYNPFMRVHLDSVANSLRKTEPSATPIEVLGHIRKLKDNF